MKKLLFITFILFLGYLSIGTAMAGINDGLVAYYPFNGNANDESGNGNNGTVYGATSTSDRFGNPNSAFYFNGIDNYIEALPLGIPSNSSFTVSYWMEFEWQDSRIWALYFGDFHVLINTNSNYGFNRGYAQIGIFDGTQNQFDIEQYQGIWTHFVTIYNADTATLTTYVNGTSVDSKSLSGYPQNDTELYIGKPHPNWASDSYYMGSLDEVRIYNRALSDAEIQELYSGTPPSISKVYGESIWNYLNCPNKKDSAGPYIGYAQVPYWGPNATTWRDSSGIGKIVVQGSNLDKISSVNIEEGDYFINGIQKISASQWKLDIRAKYVGEPYPIPVTNSKLVFTYYGGTITKTVNLIPTFYKNNQSWGQCTWYAGLVKRIINGQSEVRAYSNTVSISGDPNNPGFPKNGSVLNASNKHMAYLENISLRTTVPHKDGSITYTYDLSYSQYNANCDLSKSSKSTTMVVNKSKKGIYTITTAPTAVYKVTGVKQ